MVNKKLIVSCDLLNGTTQCDDILRWEAIDVGNLLRSEQREAIDDVEMLLDEH